jgi:hypothetical protein
VARLRQGRQSRWKDGFSVRLQKNTGKMGKSSVPVLSAKKPWFSRCFSHFWPIALAFLPIHECPCLQVLRRLVRCLGPQKQFSESRE